MRNLKKVLSLALALVMLLGMMAIGASAADFKDADSIKNTEAVNVVSGIGVLMGDENKNFNPTGTLTRAEAAVVIAKLDLGEAFGNLATTNASTFTDVGANHWAKAYIDYCAARGLIAGNGAGKFMPNDKVSGVQFALMVCRVLGYEDKAEQVGGADWEVQAAALARKAGLTKDVTIGSAAMTRDEMAQVAFNALKADMVEYRTPGTEINLGGSSVIIGGSPATVQGNTSADEYDADATTNNTKQLCEEKFPALALATEADDSFGRPVRTWKNDGEDLYDVPTGATLTYTAKETEAKVAKDLRGYSFSTLKKGSMFTNGTAESGTATDASAVDTAAEVADLTGNGRVVEIYTDKKNIEKIVVVDTYVGDVTRVVDATDTRDRSVTVTSRGKGMSGNFTTTAFEKGDVVLYNYSSSADASKKGVHNVTAAETVTGKLEKFSSAKGATVDGTTYPYAAQIVNAPASGNVDKDVTIVLDAYGNVIDVEGAAAAAKQYAYVIKATSTGGGMYNDTYYANLLLADGTKVDVKVKSKATAGQIVTYTVKDEVYTLTNVQKDSGSSEAFNLTRGTSDVQTAASTGCYIRANGSTIFFVKSAADTYSAYTGIASVPSVQGEASKSVSWIADVEDATTAANAKVAKVVYIDATATGVKSEAKDVIFVYNNGEVKPETTSDGTFYEYPAIINGEETTIRSENAVTTGLYTSVAYNTKGIATSLSNSGVNPSVSNPVAGTKKVNNDVVGIGSSWYTYAKDVSVFYVDNDGVFTAPGITGVTTDETDKVWFILNSANDVSAMFIKQEVSPNKDLLATSSTYTVADGTPVALTGASEGGTATVASGAVAIGDKITVQPVVSPGATITSCQITGGTAQNIVENSSSYTVVSTDNGGTIIWTVTIVSETGEPIEKTITITLPATANINKIKSLTVEVDYAAEDAADKTEKLTSGAETTQAGNILATGATWSAGTMGAALSEGDKVTVSAAVGSGAKVKSVTAAAAGSGGVDGDNVSGATYTAPGTAETSKKVVYTVTVTDAKNADVTFEFTLTTHA